MNTKGFIFDIKKYSINDGPGIRTTVFFKGCPLKCWWCHNPESQRILPEEFSGCSFQWNNSYGSSSRSMVGSEIFTDEVLNEIEKDIPFYEESGGGVTFSGGEPMLQFDFLYELLSLSKRKDINTAVDTTGYTDFFNLEKIYDSTDLFLYDLKLMDTEEHKKYTGVPNNKILENLMALTEIGNKIILRIPIIPSINDSERNFDLMIGFISKLKNIREINLLPYHKSAGAKYERMQLENKLSRLEPPTKEAMELVKNKFAITNYTVKIGG